MLEKYIVDSFNRQNSLSFGFRKVRCVELNKVKRNLKFKNIKNKFIYTFICNNSEQKIIVLFCVRLLVIAFPV